MAFSVVGMTRTILIAATDPNIIYLLQRYAEESGFQTGRCDDEKDLLRLARQIQPVLVILQIDPPEALWRPSLLCLKADPLTRTIPVVGYSCFDEIISSQIEGVSGFLQKSVLYSDFVATLVQAGVPVD